MLVVPYTLCISVAKHVPNCSASRMIILATRLYGKCLHITVNQTLPLEIVFETCTGVRYTNLRYVYFTSIITRIVYVNNLQPSLLYYVCKIIRFLSPNSRKITRVFRLFVDETNGPYNLRAVVMIFVTVLANIFQFNDKRASAHALVIC